MNYKEAVALATNYSAENLGVKPEVFTLVSAKMTDDNWIVRHRYEDESQTLGGIGLRHPMCDAITTISQGVVSGFETARA